MEKNNCKIIKGVNRCKSEHNCKFKIIDYDVFHAPDYENCYFNNIDGECENDEAISESKKEADDE